MIQDETRTTERQALRDQFVAKGGSANEFDAIVFLVESLSGRDEPRKHAAHATAAPHAKARHR